MFLVHYFIEIYLLEMLLVYIQILTKSSGEITADILPVIGKKIVGTKHFPIIL